MDLKAMQDKFNNLMVQADQIKMKYNGKPEDMTGQEETEWMNMLNEADKLSVRIETVKKQDMLESWGRRAATGGLPTGGNGAESGNGAPHEAPTYQTKTAKEENRGAWRKFLKGGIMALNPHEVKAYQAENPVGGGFLVAPQDFVQELITLVKDLVYVRGLATVYTVNRAESLGIPALDTDPSDADWTSELLTGNEETTMAFGKRELRPHPLAKNIKVSNKLLRQAAINPEAVIMDRLAYKFAVTQEKAYLTGNGSDQPLGVFTASAQGISTARDYTAATTTAVAGDDFIGTKYKLKAQYQDKAVWIMHRDVVAATRKLKDSAGNYLWTTSIPGWGGATGPGNGLQGTPEMLLNRPVYMSEYAPSTFTTGLYLAVLGDFSRYVIADALEMQMQVLDQLYAATNQTGYIARMESDGIDSCPLAA